MVLISFQVESHLQTQRAAVKMLHDRIMLLVQYVSDAIAGSLLHVLLVVLISDQAHRVCNKGPCYSPRAFCANGISSCE